MSDEKRAMTKSAESPARTFNGYVMLLVLLAVLAIGIWLITHGGGPPPEWAGSSRHSSPCDSRNRRVWR